MNITLTTEILTVLNALGMTKTHHPACWRDVGGIESGPKVIGHEAFDEWSNDTHSVYVVDGIIQHIEPCIPDMSTPPADRITHIMTLVEDYAYNKAEATRLDYETWHLPSAVKQAEADTATSRQLVVDELQRSLG